MDKYGALAIADQVGSCPRQYQTQLLFNDRVQLFSPECEFGEKLQMKKPEEPMKSPLSVVMNQQGDLIICDSDKHRILIFEGEEYQ